MSQAYITNDERTVEYFGKERYESPTEAIREAVGNGFGAIQRAVRDGMMEMDVGKIEVEITDDRLIVRDNGIGVAESDRDRLREVGLESDNDPHILGSWGIGRFSLMMLSADDTFQFVTRSRETGESFGVEFTRHGVEPINATRDRPGTTVSVELDDGVNPGRLYNGAGKYLDYLPVDVEVTLETEEHEGSEVHEPKSLEDTFRGDLGETGRSSSYYKTFENEDIKIVWFNRNQILVGGTRSGISLYNHMPIETPLSSKSRSFHFNVKREDGGTTTGPFGNEVTLPKATNDRGRLKEENWHQFVEWVDNLYLNYLETEVGELIDHADLPGDLHDITQNDVWEFYRTNVERVSWDNEVFNTFNGSKDKSLDVEYHNIDDLAAYNLGSPRSVFHNVPKDTEVFIGKTINERRVQTVRDQEDKYLILKIPRSRYGRSRFSYEDAETLGWNLLKGVELAPEDGEETYTVHEHNGSRISLSSGRKTRDYSSRSDISERNRLVIVFGERDELNISNFYDSVSLDVSMMNVSDPDEWVDGEQFIHAEELDIEWEPEGNQPVYTDFDMEIIEEVLPSSRDLFSIDEITVELLLWCGRTGTDVHWFAEDVPDFTTVKRHRRKYREVVARDQFPERSDEFYNDLNRLSLDSPVWDELRSK